MSGGDEYLDRFCKTTRWFHWTFALSFLSLAVTGGALLLRESLGLDAARADAWSLAHRIAAGVFLTAPWLVGLSGDTGGWLADLAEVSRFGRHDLEWLVTMATPWRRREPPPQDKLNAGQKLNALAVATVSVVFVASGLHLWRQPGAFVAVAFHVGAFAAWIPGFCVHLFMAVLNPTTRHAFRGMALGTVRRRWAEHHHARWVQSVTRR